MSLKDRAEAHANGEGSGSEVATRPMSLADRIEAIHDEFARAIPSGMARQMVQDAVQVTRTIKGLDQCDPPSVLGALMTCAQLGLRPGVNGLAWPLPFWDGGFKWFDPGSNRWRVGGHRAQLVIGYKGFVHLAYESDRLKDISARVVREGDEYSIEYAPNPTLIHRPATRGNRTNAPAVAYYALWHTTTGGVGFFDMTHEEMIQWRDQFAPRARAERKGEPGRIVGPWAAKIGSNNWIEMSLKTCIRRGVKYMPTSTGLATAAEVDGTVRVDASALTEPSTVSQIPDPGAGDGREPIKGEMADVSDAEVLPDPPESWTGDGR
jgi:recombination protein RecT